MNVFPYFHTGFHLILFILLLFCSLSASLAQDLASISPSQQKASTDDQEFPLRVFVATHQREDGLGIGEGLLQRSSAQSSCQSSPSSS